MRETRRRCKSIVSIETARERGTTRIEGVEDGESTSPEEVSGKEEDRGEAEAEDGSATRIPTRKHDPRQAGKNRVRNDTLSFLELAQAQRPRRNGRFPRFTWTTCPLATRKREVPKQSIRATEGHSSESTRNDVRGRNLVENKTCLEPAWKAHVHVKGRCVLRDQGDGGTSSAKGSRDMSGGSWRNNDGTETTGA